MLLFVTNESDLTKCTENIVPKCDGAIFHGSFVFFNGLGCVMLSQQMSPKSSALLPVSPTLIVSKKKIMFIWKIRKHALHNISKILVNFDFVFYDDLLRVNLATLTVQLARQERLPLLHNCCHNTEINRTSIGLKILFLLLSKDIPKISKNIITHSKMMVDFLS